LRNNGVAELSYVAELHGRGVPAGVGDPQSVPRYVGAGMPDRLDDVLDNLFGASGSGWLTIRSTQPLDIGTSYTFNQAADGTQQGQGLPIFDGATVMQDQRLAHAGDTVSFELFGAAFGEDATKRENLVLFVPPQASGARVEYTVMNDQGSEISSGDFYLASGVYDQVNNIQQALGTEIRPGSALRLRIHSLDENETAVYAAVSKVDNRDPLKQDPMTDEGSIDRLLGDASITMSPRRVEQGDQYALEMDINVNDGYVLQVWVDEDGDGNFNNGNYTDDSGDSHFYDAKRGTLGAQPGTKSVAMQALVVDSKSNQHLRTIQGNEYEVSAEPETYTPDNSFQKTVDNMDALVDLIGGNLNTVFVGTSMHYGPGTVREILETYTNGTVGDQDPELDRVIIRESDNSVDFRRTDGGPAVWSGFTEPQMLTLRQLYE
jgi:hypothetical protein